jgi:hypothetical protein
VRNPDGNLTEKTLQTTTFKHLKTPTHKHINTSPLHHFTPITTSPLQRFNTSCLPRTTQRKKKPQNTKKQKTKKHDNNETRSARLLVSCYSVHPGESPALLSRHSRSGILALPACFVRRSG